MRAAPRLSRHDVVGWIGEHRSVLGVFVGSRFAVLLLAFLASFIGGPLEGSNESWYEPVRRLALLDGSLHGHIAID